MVVLVDYENVNEAGLVGLKKLTKNDTLYLLHNSTSKMGVAMHCALETLECDKKYYAVTANTKNALDFQLATILGSLIGNNSEERYAIISKDTGFNVVVNYWKEQGVDIARYPNIQNISKKAQNSQSSQKSHTETKVEELFANADNKPNVDKKQIAKLIDKYKTKQGLNNALVKMFGSETTGAINKIIKPLTKDKKGK